MLYLKCLLVGLFILNACPWISAQDTLLLHDGKRLIVEVNRIDNKRFYYQDNQQAKSILKKKVREIKFSTGREINMARDSTQKTPPEKAQPPNRTAALEIVKQGTNAFVSFGAGAAGISNQFVLLGMITPTLQLPSGWVFSFQYKNAEIPSDHVPAGYTRGLNFSLWEEPRDKSQLYELGVGKLFYGKSPYKRYVIEGKIGLLQYAEVVFTERDPGEICLFCSSHPSSYPEKDWGLNVSAKASYEFSPVSVLGAALFIEAQVNAKKSLVLLGLAINMGKVRRQIYPKAERRNKNWFKS